MGKSKSEVFDIEYDKSVRIFLGRIMKVDTLNKSYEISVLEYYKGEDSNNTLTGSWDFCGGQKPSINEVWLIYDYEGEGLIHMSMCDLSRSFDWPFHYYNIPPPLSIEATDLDWLIHGYRNKQKGLKELLDDIELLRERRQ